jgi:ketosteroid isomerase-like protein
LVAEKNVELARGMVGDLNAMFELFDEHIVWDSRGHAPLDLAGIYRGKDAVMHHVTTWVGTWKEFRFEAEEIIDAGDSVVLIVDEAGKGVSSGVPMKHHYGLVLTFQNQRIVSAATYETKTDALTAAGLPA